MHFHMKIELNNKTKIEVYAKIREMMQFLIP